MLLAYNALQTSAYATQLEKDSHLSWDLHATKPTNTFGQQIPLQNNSVFRLMIILIGMIIFSSNHQRTVSQIEFGFTCLLLNGLKLTPNYMA